MPTVPTVPTVPNVPTDEHPDADRWGPDVLGQDWVARTLPMERGEPGAVATLVRRREPACDRAVLYVHGYVDYFFQTHLADAWRDAGFDFYAVDLRTHGRSIRPGPPPNYCRDLAEHAEDLDRAVAVVRAEGHDVVVVNAHSTGGLVAALWAHHRRGREPGPAADALVLNSPWLDLDRPWWTRVALTKVLDVVGRFAPRLVVEPLTRYYGESLHVDTGGPWTYDLAWKPHRGFGARAGWVRAVRRGHDAVGRGLAIDVPVLVCTSDATGPHDRWHEALSRTDSVLSVEQMVARAPLLGPDVTVVQVPGGIHDLALSPEPARTAYLDAARTWVLERLGTARR